MALLPLSLLVGLGISLSSLSSFPITPIEAVDSSSSESTETATTVSDTLSATDLAATSSTYADFSNVKKNTAVYAGRTATNGATQTRINLNTSAGIYSSVSGGLLKSVTIIWQSHSYGTTTPSRTINVYGSATAFTGLSDLTDPVGTLTYSNDGTTEGDTTTTYTVPEGTEYRYVGIKCDANTSYLESVTFEWEPVSEPSIELNPSSLSVDVSNAEGVSVSVITSNLEGELTFTIPTSDYYSITPSGSAGDYSLLVKGLAEMAETSIAISVSDSSGASASTTLTLTVTHYLTTTFTKATSVTIGKSYVLGYEDGTGNVLLAGTKGSNSYLSPALTGTLVDSTLSVLGDLSSTSVFTLSYGLVSGQYSIWSETESQFLGRGSSGLTGPSSVSDADALFNITFGTEGNVLISHVGTTEDSYTLRYRTQSGRFNFFADSNEPIYLYEQGTSPSYTASVTFADSFLAATADVCSATGEGTDTEALATAWATLSSSYETLSTVSQDLVRLANAYSSFGEGDDAIGKSLFIYDLIIGKYASSSITDFMGRGISTTSLLYSGLFSSEEETSSLIVISLIGMMSMVGGIFFLKRKRKA